MRMEFRGKEATMPNLDRLNEIAASLPDNVLGELLDFAEFLKAKHEGGAERVVAWHAALPEDEEPTSPDEEADAAAALEEAARGETLSLDELRSRHGL